MSGGALRRALAALGGLLAAGCDDGTVITRVDDRGLSRSWVVTAGAGGLPVEAHGTPFAGVRAEEAVARLRFPPGPVYDVGFRSVAPGSGETNRLVLVFNRTSAPDGVGDCRRTEPASTRPPGEVGFDVTATFCAGARALATGHMEARKTRADDPEAFTAAMRRLLRAITEADGSLR
jgi:hypothetical protein